MKAQMLFVMVVVGVALVLNANADLLLSDFNSSGFGYDYGSWTGNITTGPSYVTIASPATESGGAGDSMASASLDASIHLVSITARLGAANLASGFNVILRDQDAGGAEDFGYSFSAALFNSSTFTTATLPVTSFTFVNNAQDSIPNFDAGGNGLVGWQLQGDYSSTDTLNIEYDELNLQTIPEPTTLSLIGLALVIGLIRRKL